VPSFGDDKENKTYKKEEKTPRAADALPKDPKLPPPYKVYSTPMAAVDEDDAAPRARTVSPLTGASPVPTGNVEAMAAIMEQYQAVGAAQGAGEPMAERPHYPVAPANALPTQFFPVFPVNALPDTDPMYLPVASNRPLQADHAMITRAIVVIHDMARNANDGVAMMTTLSGADNGTTMILAPQFPLELDIARFAARLTDMGRSIVRWPLGKDVQGWEMGGNSLALPGQKGISSFTALDLLLLFLGDSASFPNLQQIVVAGHGMGGDFIERYAALGQAPDVLGKQGIVIRFLAANPSSYMYITNQRPIGQSFGVANKEACATINTYPYGLANLVPYARRFGTTTVQLRYPQRRIMTLVGATIMADPYLDQTCPAKAEGADRRARAQNYERYLAFSFGEAAGNHTFSFVANAGYDPVSLYASYCGLATLFGDGDCSRKKGTLDE
jgi:hypothetical protein